MTEKAGIERLLRRLPMPLKTALGSLSHFYQCRLKEIRLRVGQPVMLYLGEDQTFLREDGTTTDVPDDSVLTVGESLLDKTFLMLCGQSVQCYEEELQKGFFTIDGGHRVGVFGTTFIEGGQVRGIQKVSSLNIRLARQIFGVSEPVYERVFEGDLKSVLFVGPPNCGKTTLLRDLARGISNGRLGRYYKVAILDERGELSAMENGVPQYDVGFNTDVYHLCPKAAAMEMALRAGSPDVMICDEIGSADDTEMLLKNMLAGVHILASAHARTLEELRARAQIRTLLDEQVFDRVVLLEDDRLPGQIKELAAGVLL